MKVVCVAGAWWWAIIVVMIAMRHIRMHVATLALQQKLCSCRDIYLTVIEKIIGG